MSKEQLLREANALRPNPAMGITVSDLFTTLAATKESIIEPYRKREALRAAGKIECDWCIWQEAEPEFTDACGRFCSARCADRHSRSEQDYS